MTIFILNTSECLNLEKNIHVDYCRVNKYDKSHSTLVIIVFCIQSLTLHNFMEVEKATDLYIYNKTTYDKYIIIKKKLRHL